MKSSDDNEPNKKNTSTNKDECLDKLVDSALKLHLSDYGKKRKKKNNQLQAIKSAVDEYLGNFILIGYDYNGEPVTTINAKNQRDMDALYTLVQKFVLQTLGPVNPDDSAGFMR